MKGHDPAGAQAEQRVSRAQLLKAGLRSLFLESSFSGAGKQNTGFACAVEPALRSLDPALGKRARLRLLRPFSTNPFLSGLVLGAAIAFEEERIRSGAADAGPDRDELVACLASASGAQGDQLFWNTWLQFSSLAAFFVTWRLHAAWGPFLLPVLFSLAALPARLMGVFWGYRHGAAASSGRLNASVLIVRRRLQTAILFLEGLLTALILGSIPGASELSAPRALFFASALFLALILGAAVCRRLPWLIIPLCLVEAGALYFILSRL
jgi:hypothetical protein